MNTKGNTPEIFHIASLWTLSGYGDSNGEWSIDKKLDIIKAVSYTHLTLPTICSV